MKFYGSIIFSVGEKSPALFLYTQKASDFRYDVSTSKHIRKEINMAYLHSTALLLGIKDPHIKLTQGLQEESYGDVQQFRSSVQSTSLDVKGAHRKVLTVTGHLDHLPQACSHCGCLNQSCHDIIRNGTMNSVVLLGQYNFQPVYLKLKKQRYLCKHCRRTTVAITPLTRRHCFISNAVKYVIIEELAQIQSMTFIAQHLNVSTTTVIRQLKTYGDNLNPKPSRLPSHLAIDEFKSVKNVPGAMSCLLMDNATHQMVDILEDRTQRYLRAYFLRFSLEERRQVKTITMDMYSPYRDFLPRLFPNAHVIIDRFHIVQLLNRVLNAYRIRVMNRLRYTQPRDYTKLKRLWKLLLKPREALDFTHYHTHRLFDGLISEKGIVDYLIQLDAQLARTYDFVHRLIEAIRYRHFQAFETTLMESKKYVFPHKVRTAFRTLTSYALDIENSLTYTLSNGVVKGTVNKIKMIKRSGYGYRNYGHLRCRILISTHLQQRNTEPVRPLYFCDEAAL